MRFDTYFSTNRISWWVISAALCLFLSGCGGGSIGVNNSNASNGFSALTTSSPEAPGLNCAVGGSRIDAGLDANANNQLDAAEISSTQYVCSGTPGIPGSVGITSLVSMTAEVAGVNCTNSGYKIRVGLDINSNHILDDSEVTSSHYLCQGTAGEKGNNGLSALTTSSSEAPGLRCVAGGSRIDAGLDANANNKLDAAEISSTQYVCNGTPGAPGIAGSIGLASLVSMTAEAIGTNCANGGYKISVGLDTNKNSVLDISEMTSSQYLCQGSAGVNGSNAISSLMAIVAETAGANCTYGGSKITSGSDSNANGALDAGEITATAYTCNGAPGLGVSWINVSSTSVAGQSNVGYLANNASEVTVTLPNAPQIGDLLQVSGVGAGGWRIAQNAGQSVLTKGIAGSNAPAGLSWTARDSVRDWDGITSSGDGGKLAAFVQNEQIYTSTDSGATWVARESNRSWDSITSSSDGSKLAAVVNPGQIYTSSDSGVNWTARDSSRSWRAISSSSDGVKLAAVVDGGQIYTSSNSGVSWTARDSNRAWIAIASSSDGSKLAAVVANGQIYTSSDSGVSWAARDSNRNWRSIASSSDGSKLVAGVFGGQIYTSNDAGLSWLARDINRNWYAIASSSDGSKLAAAVFANKIYTSNDFGVTWAARDSNRFWSGIASSANGNKLAALESSGLIYTSVGVQTTPGVAGSITGGQYDTLSLQFVGSGIWMPLSYTIFSGGGIQGY